MHHPFVIASCPNFIGLLDRCCAKQPQRNWKIGKSERTCCVFDHKEHPIQMKRCMHLVSSKSSNSDILAFLSLECNELICIILRRTDEHTIKHMKINQKVEKNNTLYYLSSRRLFKSIIELVSFYERNDLGENFAGFVSPYLNFSKKHDFFQFNYSIVYFSTCTPFRLNQSLSWPVREVVATALYDFTPREPNQLPLRQGCQVLVIGKEGDSKGWWRGKTMERVSVNCTNS